MHTPRVFKVWGQKKGLYPSKMGVAGFAPRFFTSLWRPHILEDEYALCPVTAGQAREVAAATSSVTT